MVVPNQKVQSGETNKDLFLFFHRLKKVELQNSKTRKYFEVEEAKCIRFM